MNKNWHNKFFIEYITEDFKLKIHQELKEEFQKFYKEYDDTLCNQHSEELNIWYYSEEGQKEILRFIARKRLRVRVSSIPHYKLASVNISNCIYPVK